MSCPSLYVLQKTNKSICPVCQSKVSLLMHSGAKLEPSFYICFKCSYVAEVGVGPVTKIPNLDKQE